MPKKLEDTLPLRDMFLLKSIATIASAHNAPLYLVGGIVRDLILGRASTDYDLVVEGDAIALARALAHEHGGRVTAHPRFGTAVWHLPADRLPDSDATDSIDLATARTETYTQPAALPATTPSTIAQDLRRRDFTINALALRLDGTPDSDLLDPYGGRADLDNGIIRVLHDQSFRDDPTRILRAVRFEQRFGFVIEPHTLGLLTAARGYLDQLSGDRIRHELDRILDEPARAKICARLHQLGLLQAIHPDLSEPKIPEPLTPPDHLWGVLPVAGGIPRGRALAYSVWLHPLAPAVAQQIARRLNMPAALEKIIIDTCTLAPPVAPPSAITFHLDRFAPLSIYAVYLTSTDEGLCANLRSYAQTWRHCQANVNGHDLRAAGLPPGPRYAEILRTLRAAWLDEEIVNEQEENKLLQKLLHDT